MSGTERKAGPTARHAPDVRARATAALLLGERPAAVARNLGVPEGTVRSWKHRIKTGKSATLKKGDFGSLLMEHLQAMLRSLIVVFGTLFDRTMRMLDLAPVFGVGERGD